MHDTLNSVPTSGPLEELLQPHEPWWLKSLPVLCALQLAKENSLSALEQAIADAKKQCDEAGANDCAAAWDTVEELSAALAHKKAQVSIRPSNSLYRLEGA